MKAIVTVVGLDRVGIIGEICTMLASMNVNIVDISQTVMRDFFTMMMLVDTGCSTKTFDEIGDLLRETGKSTGLDIRIQREDIFHAMHRI